MSIMYYYINLIWAPYSSSSRLTWSITLLRLGKTQKLDIMPWFLASKILDTIAELPFRSISLEKRWNHRMESTATYILCKLSAHRIFTVVWRATIIKSCWLFSGPERNQHEHILPARIKYPTTTFLLDIIPVATTSTSVRYIYIYIYRCEFHVQYLSHLIPAI